MKPFLGIDITEDKKNEKNNGEEFIVAAATSEMSNAMKNATENTVGILKKSLLPLPIRIGHWICGCVGGLIVLALFKAVFGEDGVSLAEAYANAAWMFWLAGGCIIVWVILKIIGSKVQKEVLGDEDTQYAITNLSTIIESTYQFLGVPSDACEVDILTFKYKNKDGEIVVKSGAMDLTAYDHVSMKAYVEDDKLHLAALESNYAFPLEELGAIHTVKKHISIPSWSKEEEPTKGIYKPYKMTIDNYGCVHFKPYHILEVKHGAEIFGIYFPCYELPVIEQLTGIKAEN